MAEPARPEIGLVGLGNMGGPMAIRLLAAGHPLHVHDVRRSAGLAAVAAGAAWHDSPASVAGAADLVLVSLPTPAIVAAVAGGPEGLIDGPRMRIYVDLSTTGPEVAREVALQLAAGGVGVVDAPVSGGVKGAVAGTLAVMAACPAELFETCRPVFEAIGSSVFHVGTEVGQGQVMKLVNNALSAAALTATAEAVVVGVKAGLDARTIIDVVNAGTGRNRATEDKFPRAVLPGTFDLGFTIQLIHKDVRLFLETAAALGVPIHVLNSVQQLWEIAIAEGGADDDFSTIVKVIERWAGVLVRDLPAAQSTSTVAGGA